MSNNNNNPTNKKTKKTRKKWYPNDNYVNYDSLAKEIQDYLNVRGVEIHRPLTKAMLEHLFYTILTAVAKGDKVLLRDFGVFTRKFRKAATKTDPITGRVSHICERYVTHLKMALAAKKLLLDVPTSNKPDRPKKVGHRREDIIAREEGNYVPVNKYKEDDVNEDLHADSEELIEQSYVEKNNILDGNDKEGTEVNSEYFSYQELSLEDLNQHITEANRQDG